MTKNKKEIQRNSQKDLKGLLRQINFVPPEVSLPDVEGLIENFFTNKTGRDLTVKVKEEKLFDTDYETAVKEALEIVRSEIRDYPDLYHYIFEQSYEATFDVFEVLDRYKMFVYHRYKIQLMAEEISRNPKNEDGRFIILQSSNHQTYVAHYEILGGKITFQTDNVYKALEGADPDKLRLCKRCNRIFWAGRKDKMGCSTKCNQTLRQQKRRKVESEEKKRLDEHFKSRVKKK